MQNKCLVFIELSLISIESAPLTLITVFWMHWILLDGNCWGYEQYGIVLKNTHSSNNAKHSKYLQAPKM